MANISFPISLWLFALLICPGVAFASLTEEDFTFADNANHNIDKSAALLPPARADYRIRENAASLQDEEGYHTRQFYSRKLMEVKEAGLAPTPSPPGSRMKEIAKLVFYLLMLFVIILVQFLLFVAVVVVIIYFFYYVGLLFVTCARYAVDAVKKLWA
ncbi:hypothetical protein RHMOL_Rhmol05G0038700 [Rhododendron molle]|uniref:Uncharacterized protein n=1 Tax=Rhododendron molle TaxID=49168 RepID=A0ACC0NM89_RHOML|nr:hypothetical protein RHMOL_Rhmol05G0038700 [Rhododendron molle]